MSTLTICGYSDKECFFKAERKHKQKLIFQYSWSATMQAKISLVNTQVKGEMVLTDFDLATGYVQRKQNIRKR